LWWCGRIFFSSRLFFAASCGGILSVRSRGGRAQVRQAALVCRAYVSLCLDDPLSSLSAATDVFHMDPTPSNRYLAHTYAAEALCMLDRPSQAEKHLAPTLVNRERAVSRHGLC
jgi:hypothetical protein